MSHHALISIVAAALLAIAIGIGLALAEEAYCCLLRRLGKRSWRYTASGHPRSGKWPAFERKLIAARGGVCEACGGSQNLEGHHVQDFHAHPALELDPDNVAVLCGPKGRNCHLRIGHSFDFRAINPRAREDAAQQRYRIRTRVYE